MSLRPTKASFAPVNWHGNTAHKALSLDNSAAAVYSAAGGVGGLLAVKPAGGPAHFAGYDGNGNVTALVNGNDGSTSAQYEYGPFGELIRMTGAMAASNPIRFSSKFTDDETDLIYYGFRYYNPSTGRWLCRDPIGEAGGMNLYAFARNLSLNAIDPWGLIEIPAGVQEYINAYQAETGYFPWVGWWDTHQDRAHNGWYFPGDYELYGLVWYPTWVDIAIENRPPGTWDLPYGHLPTNKYGSDPTKKYSLIAMWADELDAAKDLAEGAIQATTLRDELAKDLLWGMAGGVAGKVGGKILGESIESILDWRSARNVGKIADNGGLAPKGTFKPGEVMPDGRIAGDGPGAALKDGPDFPGNRGVRLTDEQEVFRRLQQYHGVDRNLASERLHQIKRSGGYGGGDNVVFDLTGNVYHPTTGELIGSLTQGGRRR